jgi:hypothetical protein
MKTYNQLVAFFNSIANAHYFIKSFGNGWDTEADLAKNNTYPYLHITPLSNSVEENTTTYRIGLVVCDLVKEDDSNLNEVLSDTNQTIKDIVKILRNENNMFGILEAPTLNPFRDKYADLVAGWQVELSVEVNFNNGYCDIPSDAFGDVGAGCPDVTILDENGDVIDTIEAGGSYVCNTSGGGVCLDSDVTNSNATYNATVASGGTLVLPNTTYDIYVNGVFNVSTTVVTLDNNENININA